MLSSAQLLSDRLITVKDPTVQRLVPKLIASLDRAIRLCARTLELRPGARGAAAAEALSARPAGRRDRRQPRAAAAEYPLDRRVEARLEVDADRDQLYRVLSNLCRNAVQALESESDIEGEIAVAGRREGSVTVIEVTDTGPGVPERARAHLFEAFQSVARKGGSGLGLAIAHELVQAHGGQIALISNEGGATFRVTIPDMVVELKRARKLSA